MPIASIFDAPWSELEPRHVQDLLDHGDDEPLLWEAKGTELCKREVRRQVCGFANSHEGGFLILGARRATGEGAGGRWELSGMPFPDEPLTWLTNVVSDQVGGVRPRPDFDIAAWPVDGGHVAVVRVQPISTPPCITNGTIYERLPGKTEHVRDPMLLAGLFRRGDEARRDAQARADRAAGLVMEDSLEGQDGIFEWPSMARAESEQVEQDETTYIRFAVGVASTGNPPNISGRLFKADLAEDVWGELRARSSLPGGFHGRPPDAVEWSQQALLWRHQSQGHVSAITIVRAGWDGAVAAGQKLSTEDVYPDHLAETRIAEQWRFAEGLMHRLGAFGDIYTTALVAGGRFPRRKDDGWIVMRRGPLLPGVDDEHVAGLGRELMRALGSPEPEP